MMGGPEINDSAKQDQTTGSGPTANNPFTEAQVAPTLRHALANLVDAGSDALIALGHEIASVAKEGARFFQQSASEFAALLMDSIAAEPEKKRNFAREVFSIIPVLGTSTAFASAWRKFHHADATKNEDLKQESRVECIKAMIDAKVDFLLLTTMGQSGLIMTPLKAAVGAVALGRASRPIGLGDLDTVEVMAKKIGETDVGKHIADAVMSAIKPFPVEVIATPAPATA